MGCGACRPRRGGGASVALGFTVIKYDHDGEVDGGERAQLLVPPQTIKQQQPVVVADVSSVGSVIPLSNGE